MKFHLPQTHLIWLFRGMDYYLDNAEQDILENFSEVSRVMKLVQYLFARQAPKCYLTGSGV